MKKIFIPKIEKFSNEIDQLNINNENIRVTMIQLDSNLSLKLSKSALLNVEEDFNTKFVSHEYGKIIEKDFEKL
jgi:hypothetical protein